MWMTAYLIYLMQRIALQSCSAGENKQVGMEHADPGEWSNAKERITSFDLGKCERNWETVTNGMFICVNIYICTSINRTGYLCMFIYIEKRLHP
jgi:hypothetical protein